mmetsp:Transcript_4327/g.12471  ORF Transcript_4327/g.12471 Transcript_4327/m.12471 type:complete len:139 (-) Transcript_4327:341-757(-)|eukprot:CAMPEP_0206139462 /NCGR_PEP_ID=MMETSP1473-20131121/6229_1 /ASSEMBLY_ACC=CAM_ASM_001109 /TAXON_ID=1461547 /ORGANISM="Stichococcus sp, Strain RCC1054" /LENGTH=138 /DNA_ID=CAMNT_0053533269 /DNA_START=267 /DNA_END=683 /DNA_ORIENTATION=+
MSAAQPASQDLANAATEALHGSSGVVIFDGTGRILHTTFQSLPSSDLTSLTASFGDRDEAIRNGLHLQGRRYEVVNHYPPLVYGRCMTDVDPEVSSGAAVYQLKYQGATTYVAITYQLPHTSARLVAQLREFCRKIAS